MFLKINDAPSLMLRIHTIALVRGASIAAIKKK
jgi:hypothetical protein